MAANDVTQKQDARVTKKRMAAKYTKPLKESKPKIYKKELLDPIMAHVEACIDLKADKDVDCSDNFESETHHSDYEDDVNDKDFKKSQDMDKVAKPFIDQDAVKPNLSLEKQLNGLLNRLSMNNFESIAISIAALYQSNPRREVSEILFNLILKSISAQGNLLDSFILVFAALVSTLSHIIGTEFSGFIIQKVVDLLDSSRHQVMEEHELRITNEDDTISPSRQIINLVTFISFLYNLQIVSYKLVSEIIKECIATLDEIDTEIILKLIRNCGVQFKKDDQSTIFEIIQLLDSRLISIQADTKSTRFRFMIESIYDLKNNKQRSVALHQGDLETAKKMIRAMIRKGAISKHEPLRIGLEDIRNITIKGKWWLVGGSWNPGKNDLLGKNEEIATGHTDKILLMAKNQRMNTDVRKAIFTALISSGDYIDAFNRLSKLKLSSKQEREIIMVILHCVSRVSHQLS